MPQEMALALRSNARDTYYNEKENKKAPTSGAQARNRGQIAVYSGS